MLVKKKMKKFNKKKIILNIITLIFAMGIIYSCYSLIMYKIDEKNTKEQLKKIEENVEVVEIEENGSTEVIEESNNSNMNLMNADFDKLKSINSDVKGWITVNGTNINYPFVQGKDNSYYLRHSFDKSYNNAGWVFLDYKNNLLNDKNTVLYAHSMRNRTMFGSLRNILKNNWVNNSNNHIIKLSTENENTLWQVFSVYHIKTTSDYIKTRFNSDNEFEKFINMISKRSFHNFNTEVSIDDKVLTLSTCYSNAERLVLHAKLIKREAK